MAVSLTGSIQLLGSLLYQNPLDMRSVEDQLPIQWSKAFTSGTGADQVNRLWADQRTLASLATEDLDLAGVLVDGFGVAIAFAKIKAMLFRNNSIVAGENLEIGGAGANGFINWIKDATDIVILGPGGILALIAPVDGYAVIAATGDLLTVTNAGAASIIYDVVLVGNA